MKWLYSIIVFFIFPLSSVGQVRVVEEDGRSYDCAGGGGVGDVIFAYRVVYDRYPHSKKELLVFLKKEYTYNYSDSLINSIVSKRKDAQIREIKNHKNKLSASGDTCFFYIAANKSVIQCVAGVKSLLDTDYDAFRSWIHTCCYDKKGRYIASLYGESPSLPREMLTPFQYVVMMEPHYPNVEIPIEKEGMRPIFIPFTMTRSGNFDFDLSYLEGRQLFYSNLDQHSQGCTYGPIAIEDAVNPDYLGSVRKYMNDFLDTYPEVESIKLWERLLFNRTP